MKLQGKIFQLPPRKHFKPLLIPSAPPRRSFVVLVAFSFTVTAYFVLMLLNPVAEDGGFNDVVAGRVWIAPAKIDWHDYAQIERERRRRGPGEQGVPAVLDTDEEVLNEALLQEHAYNALLSDKIALDRALPDTRPSGCQKILYNNNLPPVSIVIIFHNEYLSVLLRTIHSVINRSPSSLLNEIILVDDASTKAYLRDSLELHTAKLSPKIRLVRLSSRSGLMKARMAGIKAAISSIVVIMDSHVEVNVNWLPPLIQPIAENPKVVTSPVIDFINWKTFEYNNDTENGVRGAFDWDLTYVQLSRGEPKDGEQSTDPFNNPIMLGAFFAIGRDFFWELGGYDDQLEIWGGEQIELSLKIWLCGGALYNVPCSRAGHNYKGGARHPFMNPINGTYIHRNYKRVIEVWFDGYQKYVYDRHPDGYGKVDEGDLTEQRALKERLHCKSFQWYLDNIVPELLKYFPPTLPPDFASGVIQNVANQDFCVDIMQPKADRRISLYYCSANLVHPQPNQFFSLSTKRDIRLKNGYNCLDAVPTDDIVPVMLQGCHGLQGNQMFRYDMESKQLQHGLFGAMCLDADFTGNVSLFVTTCDEEKKTQQWEWGFVNETNLANWENYGDEIIV